MKRLLVLILMTLVVFGAFASGTQETPRQITILHGGQAPFPNGDTPVAHATELFHRDYPDVEVVELQLDLSDGSTLTMDAMLAAGTPPNIYLDYVGRVSKYITPDYALALDPYIRDLDQYLPSALAPYRRDGKLYGMPQPGGAQGMAVNLEIMAEIGFTPTFDWTVADFLRMAELVKQRYNGTKYATGMFAGNQSGDYLINNWFSAFGAEFFADGYDHTTIAENGAQVYEFFQTLVRNEYVPPDAAVLVDDDYVIQWAKGDLAATAFFPGWLDPYFKTVIEQGLIDEPFPLAFFPFPSVDGSGTPTYISSGALVVRNTGTEQDAWAARFAEYLNDAYVQSNMTYTAVIPNRVDAEFLLDSPHVEQTAKIVAENGVYDMGLTNEFFARIRPAHFPVLQKVLNLAVTPEEAILEYARRIDEEL